jgi:hypothetical protein
MRDLKQFEIQEYFTTDILCDYGSDDRHTRSSNYEILKHLNEYYVQYCLSL